MIPYELIIRAQSGEHQALIDVLMFVEHQVYQTAYYMLRNEQDALDITQDALLRIYQKINTFQKRSQFKTWVQRITTNLCIDFLRKKKVTISIEEHDLIFQSNDLVETKLLKDYEIRELHQAIHELAPTYRTIMILRYVHDFSYQEIADTMELPLNTVKSHIFRAKQLLYVRLYDHTKKENG